MLSLDDQILLAIQAGIPVCSRPYQAVAEQLSISEDLLLQRLQTLREQTVIRRWGVVVKHRPLGYTANAMIVLDVPDQQITDIGKTLSAESSVNLCYQRPRQGQDWPYNLYCMIHGKDKASVLEKWQVVAENCQLTGFASEILFSRRCFKQRGAWYQKQGG